MVKSLQELYNKHPVRVEEIVLPILRDNLDPDVTVTSWTPDIDYRTYPIVHIRRMGGYRSRSLPLWYDKAVLEITALTDEGVPESEVLYNEILDILFKAKRRQTIVPGKGYINLVDETMGMTQMGAQSVDTYRVQGLVKVYIRPIRTGATYGT